MHNPIRPQVLPMREGVSASCVALPAGPWVTVIDFLVQHTIQHAFTCRLRWKPGMVCMWDNASNMHLGPNDYDGFRREMYRTTIAGGVPV